MVRSPLLSGLALFLVVLGAGCERQPSSEVPTAPEAPASAPLERKAASLVASEAACPAEPDTGPRPTELLYVGHARATYGASIPLEALLTDARGLPLGNRLVQFQLGEASASATTNEWGAAYATLPATAAPGEHPLTLAFAGDPEQAPARVQTRFIIERAPTVLVLEVPSVLAVGAAHPVSARLTLPDGEPLAGKPVRFTLAGLVASGRTDGAGVARVTLTLPASPTGPATVQASFAGDALHGPSEDSAGTTRYLPVGFVLWGGNTPGLALGDRVNFWGHSWEKQVTGGAYAAHAEFKGWAATRSGFALCQPTARPGGTPALTQGCWSSKGGQSGPPATLPEYIGVLISNAMDKQGGTVYGNVAALGVVKVDAQPPYGPVPGKPGWGTLVDVVDGGALLPAVPALSADQRQPAKAVPGQGYDVTLTVANLTSTRAVAARAVEASVGSEPATAEQLLGDVGAGESRTATFAQKPPVLAVRGADESERDYQQRLAAHDGLALSSTATVSFGDPHGRPTRPARAFSSGRLTLPRLVVSLKAPPCVTPGMTLPYTVTVFSLGQGRVGGGTATVTFPDGTQATVALARMEPATAQTHTVTWTVPALAPRGEQESADAYFDRLREADGKALTASVAVQWTDVAGNPYGTLSREVKTVQRLPTLTLDVAPLSTLLPSEPVALKYTVKNAGSGPAPEARLSVRPEEGSALEPAPFALAPGETRDVELATQAPPFPPRGAAEDEAAYRARLGAANGRAVTFTHALTWTDLAANGYGPLDGGLRTFLQVPFVDITLAGPATATSGDSLAYTVTLRNRGLAEATAITVRMVMPDGSSRTLTLPVSTLARGVGTTASTTFGVPNSQPAGQVTARAEVLWQDARGNAYGPLSASTPTDISRGNLPPVVDAGPDRSFHLPQDAALAGSASDDGQPEGSVLTTRWVKVSGPGTVLFADAGAPVTRATFSLPGTYVLRLTASDSQLLAQDEMTVTVLPREGQGTEVDPSNPGPRDEVINVVRDGQQLRLDDTTRPFNFIWVAVSTKGTVVKIDTNTGAVLGEYWTAPNNEAKDPSRTTVDKNGSVWATNRANNSVVHIGLVENGQCKDRNNNGVIDTSRGYGDVRAWGNVSSTANNAAVLAAQDECILHYVKVRSSGTRHVSVTEDNDVWVSGTGGSNFDLIDGSTGVIRRQENSVGYGGYGGLIDRNGVIWSARSLMRWDTARPLTGVSGVNWRGYGHDSYGLCLDPQGNVWNTSLANNRIYKFAPDGTQLGVYAHGSYYAQGCVAAPNGDIWVAHSLYGNTVGHLKNDGRHVGNVTVGSGPTGVAVDGAGKVWATNYYSGTVTRIDPNAGPVWSGDGTTRVGAVDFTTRYLGGNLYNYSDMTGSTLSGAPDNGTFSTVFDSTVAGSEWGRVSWTGQVCGDGTVRVTAASSADGVTFGAPVAAPNGQDLNLANGRYLKVTVALSRSTKGDSPRVYGLTVGTAAYVHTAPANQAPVVRLGADRAVTSPNALRLTGSACDDALPSGGPLAMTWTRVSGPGTVTFSRPNAEVTDASFSAPGRYVLRLTASDGALEASDDIEVDVLRANAPPVVDAGPALAINLPATATLNGSASDDGLPEGSSITLEWSRVSGPGTVTFSAPTQASTQATFSVSGTYVLRLSAFDGHIRSSADVTVVAHPPPAVNKPPVVSAGPNRSTTLNTFVALSGSVTDDGLPAGRTVTQQWTRVSGPGTATFSSTTAAATSVRFDVAGLYVLRLTATDTELSSSAEVSVAVGAPAPTNAPPQVSAGPNQSLILPQDTLALGGSASDDGLPAGAGLTVTWTQVSGPATVTFTDPSLPNTTARFPVAGTYVVRLSASDTNFTAWAEKGVVVRNPPEQNLPPVVSAGPAQEVTLPTRQVNLTGTVQDDGRPTGGALTARWSVVSGPAGGTFGNAQAAATTFSFTSSGTYVLRLTGSDSALASAADTVVVARPAPAGNQPPVVSAGGNQQVSLPDAVATLNGTVTDDGLPQGASVTVTWERASGPGPVEFGQAPDGRVTARFFVAGDYVLRLTANDTERVSSSIVQIRVLPDLRNRAPQLGVSAPTRVAYPGPALLSGSVSDDGLPATGVLTLAWTQESGPGTVTFSRPDQASTQATFSAGGTYGLRLTATDGELTSSVLVSIEVLRSNQRPVVSAGPDRRITYPQRTLTLAGTAQDDGLPQGSPFTTRWTLVDGPADVTFGTPTQPTTTATFPTAGTYVLRLTGSDGVLEASDDVTVVLDGPTNLPPVVDVGPSVSATLPGALRLGARASDDGLPNPVLALAWSQVSGPGTVSFEDRTLADTVATFPSAGTYVLRLSASDGETTVSADLVVAGRPGGENQAPTLDSAPPTVARAGVLFTHPVLATDANGDMLTFRLITGPDGMTLDARSGLLSWRPQASDVGRRVDVALRVSDPAGLFVDQAFQLEVLPGDAAPRITSRPPLSAAAGSTYAYAAAASDVDDVQLTWSVQGPAGMEVSASGAVSWPVPADAQGGFPVVLRATDAAGHVGEQRFTIGVAVPGNVSAPVVLVTSPTQGERITSRRDLIGTVQDDDLTGFTVRACRLDEAAGCLTLAEGLRAVSAGKLADVDPMLLADGRYAVLVTARDAGNRVTERKLEVEVATGNRKAPALRLAFPEMRVETRTAELLLKRVYDGLDLSAGPLGRGWRYEWDSARITQPRPVGEGWVVQVDTRGFIPRFVIRPTVDHPISVKLDDGRSYQFEVFLEHDGSLSTIHPAKPIIREQTTTGSTLTLLGQDFTPYQDFDVVVVGNEVYEWDFSTQWEPQYGQLKTEYGETLIFDLDTRKLVALEDGEGQKLELSETGLKLNGSELVRFEKGADGLIARALNVPTGARAVYQRDANGLLVKATTAEGSVQTFTYDAEGRMVSFTTDGQSPERFEYDEKGRVALHITPTGVAMRTEYDDAARTTKLIDPAGNTVLSEYDASGNIVRVVNPLGETTRFTYKPGTSLETSRTDALGNVWRTEYDARGRRTALVNPMGERTMVVYAASSSRILEVTDGAGRRYAENVDAAGRTVAHVLPDGTLARTFTYPSADTVVSKDAQGRTRTTRYDARGREVSVTDEDGNVVTTTFDDASLTATVNRGGTTSRVGLDRAGRITRLEMGGGQNIEYTFKGGDPMPVAITRPDGVRVEYERNADGRLTALRVGGQPVQQARFDALGRLASVQRNGVVERFKYDAAGRVVETVRPEGTLYTKYDAAGRVVERSSSNGVLEKMEYDKAGRVTALEDGTGQRHQVTYDASGQPTSVTTPDSRTFQVSYDANGRRNGVTYPGGISASWTYEVSDDMEEMPPMRTFSDLEGVQWQYAHDGNGRLAAISDSLGGTTRYTRGPTGEVTRLMDALGRTTRFDQGPAGIEQLVTPAGRTQLFTYEPGGRTETWTRSDGTTVRYRYTGQRLITELPSGGTLEEVHDPVLGAYTSLGGAGGNVARWVNAEGETTRLETSDGARLDAAYAEDGRLTVLSATTPDGRTFTSHYGHDAAGRLTDVVDPSGAATRYTYDARGRLERIERPNGVVTTYGYGQLDRPARVEHRAGSTVLAVHEFTFDTRGRVIARRSPEGRFEYEYDALSRLAVERKLDGAGTVLEAVTRTWDAVGNLASLTDSRGTTTYAYDADDRLLSETGPGGTTTYTWSGRGALERIDAPTGTTRFTYDDLDRLTEVQLPDGQRVRYGYDASGRLLSRTDASGTRRCLPLPRAPRGYSDCALEYGDAPPVARAFGPEGVASLHEGASARHLLAGLQGDVVGATDDAAALVSRASYSPFGEQRVEGEALGYGYTGERQDAATGLVFLRARWYHPATGRFLTPDRYGATSNDPRTLHRYLYALGNPLNRIDPSGEFTLGSVMISISISDVLRSMDVVVKKCLQNKLKGKLFRSIAEWAAQKFLMPVAEDALKKVAAKLMGNVDFASEFAFHEALAEALCGNGVDADGFNDFIEFEYRVERPCGNKLNRPSGRPSLIDCFENFRTNNGIDIVFGEIFPLELKMKSDTFSDDQLLRYCRFGATGGGLPPDNGLHVMVYGFFKMPSESFMDEKAKMCWKAFESAPNCGTNAKNFPGSVLFAFGVYANSDNKHYYAPDPDNVCQ
jgi:RHS repeat-associated protein/uncharacterized repeat protein (TIGR01451 family)